MDDSELRWSEARRRRQKRLRLVVWVFLGAIGVGVGGAVWWGSGSDKPDVGLLEGTVYARPEGVPAVQLSVATAEWGIDEVDLDGADPMSGGIAPVDLDNDGDLDLVVANGSVKVLLWDGGRYGPQIDLGVADAVSVAAGDLDSDGWTDLLIARTGGSDLVVWGGEWLTGSGARAEPLGLAGGAPSAILLPADLDGDGRLEIVRLGRGGRSGTPDVIWSQTVDDPRSFTSVTLPGSDRLSLAAAIADVDGDGLLDIWVTRDVGWDLGGDSVYSRRGDRLGRWVDVADTLRAGLAIDGMGVTLADFDSDSDIDAYLSDIGDNEVLLSGEGGFVPSDNTGAARIRPPGTPSSVVSSSWASGAADLNLDGRLDLVVVGGGFPDGGVRNKIAGTSVALEEPPAILVGIDGRHFVDDWPLLGLDLSLVGRSMALGDFDGDGDTDIVIVSQDGALTALKNDSDRRSVTVEIPTSCGDGVEVEIATEGRVYRSVVPAQTYGGSHARQVVVGLGDEPTTIRVDRPGDDLLVLRADQGSDRSVRVVAC